jgi:hypothetical protein
MKRSLLLFVLCLLVCAAACGQEQQSSENTPSSSQIETSPESASGDPSKAEARVSFEINDTREGTYKDHVAELWEQTKAVMREDILAEYTDEEYQELGQAIENAWTNLQAHSSIHHADEAAAADENVTYANVTGKIKDLIFKTYGNGAVGTPEKREEKRENLRGGGLERLIEDIDEIVYSKTSQ